jgi:translation initiation factor IF-2
MRVRPVLSEDIITSWTIISGALDTMRILKKDVIEIRKGSECGLSLVDFADLREGDLIQMCQTIEKPGVL